MRTSGFLDCEKLKSGGWCTLADWWVDTGITGHTKIILDKRTRRPILFLGASGRLYIYAGYQWDGASGPVIDRATNMRASLAHDAIYQLLRAKKLGQEYRIKADEIYRLLHKADGGWGWVGWIDFAGMRVFSGYAAKPQPEVEAKTYRFGKAA